MVWGFVQALLQYCWYAVLNSLYKEDNLFLSTLKRVLTDQLFILQFRFCLFIYSTIVMGRGDRAALIVKLRSAYLQTLVVNYAVWPAAQFVNFLLMPVSSRFPLLLQLVSFGMPIFLSKCLCSQMKVRQLLWKIQSMII